MNSARSIKVGINATSLLSPLTGIGKYTYHLCKTFQQSENVDLKMFYNHDWSDEIREQPVKNIVSLKNNIKRLCPYSYKLMRVIQNYRFRKTLDLDTLDIYHDPNYLLFDFPGKKVITVHDLSFKRYPEVHPKERISILEKYFPRAVDQADAIITDSYFSARELMKFYPVKPEKIHTIHLGVEKDFHPRTSDELKQSLDFYGLSYRKYILVVGTLEPRKNLTQVLLAYSKLPLEFRHEYPLVIAGMRGWGTSEIEQQMAPLIADGQLKLTGYVPDDMLPKLYSGAKMFVYPSLYEGFGLPPLEAMASGVPVITSNQASLPEVVENAGIQVAPFDIDGLSEHILSLLNSDAKCDEMIKLGLSQAKKFTWERCAEETIEVYKSLVSENI